jgi:predicted transcriptional regulator
MVEATAPTRRRRLGAHGMMFRRRRIFARLREGFTYEEIANDEGVTITRIRQIVSKELEQRKVDSGAEHAKLQLERLASVMQLAAEAVAAGDVSAITPYLKVIDRLDRYQAIACVEQAYDDEARKKLLDKINRIADNLGIDENFAAAVQAHLKATAGLPPDGWGEDGAPEEGEELAATPELAGEANAPEGSRAEARAGSGFFYANAP